MACHTNMHVTASDNMLAQMKATCVTLSNSIRSPTHQRCVNLCYCTHRLGAAIKLAAPIVQELNEMYVIASALRLVGGQELAVSERVDHIVHDAIKKWSCVNCFGPIKLHVVGELLARFLQGLKTQTVDENVCIGINF